MSDAFIDNLCSHLISTDLTLQSRLELLHTDPYASWLMHASLAQADYMIECIKAQADVYRRDGQTVDAANIGEVILAIGKLRGWFSYQGLGHMVCGDAYNREYRYEKAWGCFDQATRAYDQAIDAGEPEGEFNKARVVIGMLWAAIHEIKQLGPLVEEKYLEAAALFDKSAHPSAYEKRLSLDHNYGIFWERQGQYDRALPVFQSVLEKVTEKPEPRPGLRAEILFMIAGIHHRRGELELQNSFYQQALEAFDAVNQFDGKLYVQSLIAYSRLQQDKISACLADIDDILYHPNLSAGVWLFANRIKIHCFLQLGDFDSVEREVQQILEHPYAQTGGTEWQAAILEYTAIAQAEQGRLTQAHSLIDQIIAMYASAGNEYSMMYPILYRASIGLYQGQVEKAEQDSTTAYNYFINIDAYHTLDALVIRAELAYKRLVQETNSAGATLTLINSLIEHSQQLNSLHHVHIGYVLLGHVYHYQGNELAAEQSYWQAVHIIDQLQRELTIAYRPSFLRDKAEALHALINGYIAQNRPIEAFLALEHIRQQTWENYTTRHNIPPWIDTPQTVGVRQELDGLRQKLLMLLNQRTDTIDPKFSAEHQQYLTTEIHRLSQRIRALTQSLYNHPDHHGTSQPLMASDPQKLDQLLDKLPPHGIVVCYYDNGTDVHAFLCNAQGYIHIVPCASSSIVWQAHQNLDRQIKFAIANLKNLPPQSQSSDIHELIYHPQLRNPTLRRTFEMASKQLYDLLVAPWQHYLSEDSQVFIVPHRRLYTVPFNLLFDGGQYLITRHELCILPSAFAFASVSARPTSPHQNVVVYDDRQRKLARSASDAAAVAQLLETTPYAAATQPALFQQASGNILHIIAHAQFSPNSPETAFIQYGDQLLLLHDIMQGHLQFQLVTLTACEAGRYWQTEHQQRLAAGDDVLSLGRAFLYAGAQSVLTSQWLLGDGLTLPELTAFYTALQQGRTLAEAIQQAQRMMLTGQEWADLHPIFCGTFYLTTSFA